MNYREKMRKAIECPQFENINYGEWGTLRLDQRKNIKRLLDEMDKADEVIKHQFFEIERLNHECDTYMKIASKRGNIINELENGLKEEIDRLEKVALENKNNKFEFDKLVLIRGKVMDIYDELKELKEGK